MDVAQGTVGITVDEIPQSCWDMPGFEDDYYARVAALELQTNEVTDEAVASGACDKVDYYDCFAGLYFPAYDALVAQMMQEYGCYAPGPGLPQYGDACTSYNSVVAAQIALRNWVPGLAVDGNWGKNSQAALEQSGVSYQTLVPGCTPPIPNYGSGGTPGPGPGGGGGGGGGGGLTNVDAKENGSSSSGLWMLGVGFAAVLGIGAAVAITRKRKSA